MSHSIKHPQEKQKDKIHVKTSPSAVTNILPVADKRYHTRYASGVDAEALFRDLSAAIKGEVRFDAGSRALYATDASNYRQVPIGVVLPLDEEDVSNAIAISRKHGAPLLSRGGGGEGGRPHHR